MKYKIVNSSRYRLCVVIDKWSVMGLTGAFWSGMIDMNDLETFQDVHSSDFW